MAAYLIKDQTLVASANGNVAGYIAITNLSSAATVFPGCTVFLQSDTVAGVECLVTKVDAANNRLYLQIKPELGTGPKYTNSDLSAYTLANNAKVYVPQQTITWPYNSYAGLAVVN